MSKQYIYLFDTTLRDGAQTQGIDFSYRDKCVIASMLDDLGVDYIEGGWPGANPVDDKLFDSALALSNARLIAFGMTRRAGRSAQNDVTLSSIINAKADGACLVAKSWDFHVDVALEIAREENLKMIGSSIELAHEKLGEAMLDCEHFFDGYKANPEYAIQCARAGLEAGARWIVLCDTNGGTLPHEIHQIVKEVTAHIPGENLGIHAHNDTGNAIANSLAAIHAGACQIQGTINGLGERCGNADIISLIAILGLKTDFSIAIPRENLTKLSRVSYLLNEQINRAPNPYQPWVGSAAFAHKGGLHASAVAKDPRTYEHIEPTLVGNQRIIITSNQSGRANLRATLASFNVEMSDKNQEKLLKKIKDMEAKGFSYDGAYASLELLVRDAQEEALSYFTIERFRVIDERRHNAIGKTIYESEATVTVCAYDNEGKHHSSIQVARGNGPVNALDQALRFALTKLYPILNDIKLSDYKVRILSTEDASIGTQAVTRVTIESSSQSMDSWITVGVSTNVIEASVQALSDSYVWYLLKNNIQLVDSHITIS